jgi:uncharacterized membrane protein
MKQLTKTLGFSSALSLLLLLTRIEWSGSISYIFLVWNLFLAWIPFIAALLFAEVRATTRNRWQSVALLFCWLIFFPNAPYILTDLFHFHQKPVVPLWYDLVLILSFAWNGLLLGFASLFEIQKHLRMRFREPVVDAFVALMLIMCSFGIYLGRYPRFNSWDILSNPLELFGSIVHMLLHPFDNTRMVGVTFFFSLFLIASFWTLKAMVHNLKHEKHEL